MKPRLFFLAEKLAQRSEHKYQLGCIIAKGNRVLGRGYNKAEYSRYSTHQFKTRHAECSALLDCGMGKARGADLYVYRATKDGATASSKPCNYCQEMLRQAGIRRIYYTSDVEPYFIKEVL